MSVRAQANGQSARVCGPLLAAEAQRGWTTRPRGPSYRWHCWRPSASLHEPSPPRLPHTTLPTCTNLPARFLFSELRQLLHFQARPSPLSPWWCPPPPTPAPRPAHTSPPHRVPTLHPQRSRRTPVWHWSLGLPGGLISDCRQQDAPVEASAAISCLLGHHPRHLAPPPDPVQPHAPTRSAPAARASTLTKGAGRPRAPTAAAAAAAVAWQVPRRRPGPGPAWPASSVRPAGNSRAALEWAGCRTSPRSWGAPQANQERLSRYKASQSGGSAPFPHSLPSQIVTMGTITKKTAPKCNHFPVNFYPSAPPPLDLGSLVS